MTAAAHDFEQHELEERRDRWIALVVGIVIHLVAFVITFPAVLAEVDEPEDRKGYVVQPTPRFKARVVDPEPDIPQELVKRVPIPDPTPDDPEPIRLLERLEAPLSGVDTGAVFEFPAEPPPQVAPSGPIRVGGDVTRPTKVSAPPPVYTEMARKAGIEGVVIVEAVIDPEGRVTDVKVLKPLPLGLAQSAVDAIRRWRFEPATLGGTPVEVFYVLTVNFQLQR